MQRLGNRLKRCLNANGQPFGWPSLKKIPVG